ncbi:MAG TPA: 1-(5-phosphoribosyl)-5-[(5-phosphoribosylamino)methylideneamino]imidazole-4-carboxamide isomerase [Candidatus Omnitrophota bacterium]|nr:1-(5-phosphoribosyl)-5-[(5-phosphoribosylamino)methylideneamino]imidazole-4-carboxamide isomerase [Candidatus Omnitrophota bacterium]
MIIFPAIDIKEGKVVRLMQGNFNEVTEYSGSPVAMAKLWQAKGAPWLHVIDLDGAQTGQTQNTDKIIDIAQSVSIPVQTGGGIRAKKDIEKLLNGGVARVILGTKGVEDLAFLKEVIGQWQEKIAVSLDCSNGIIAQRGWTETSGLKATDFVKELEKLGLSCLIYTDISRDGMMSGPNVEALTELAETTTIPIIASGGISKIDDIKALLAIEDKGIFGIITGKAIYEGKLNLKEALNLCSPKE